MTELEKDLAKVVKDKAKHTNARAEALKILFKMEIAKMKCNAWLN